METENKEPINENGIEVNNASHPQKRVRPNEVVNEESSQIKMTASDVASDLTDLYSVALHNYSYGYDKIYDFNAYNPFLQNQRLKHINSTPNNLGREDLISCLASPGDAELPLRQQGWSLSAAQYLYYKILRFASDIPNYKYYKIPDLLEKSEYNKQSFKNEDEYIDRWLRTFNVANSLKKCALEVKREGKCTYVLRNAFTEEKGKKIPSYAVWQKLPSDYIKLTGIGEYGYTASMNFMIFANPAYSPKQYPPFIQEIWEDLIDTGIITESISRVKTGMGNKKGELQYKYSIGDFEKAKNYKYNFTYDYGASETLSATLEFQNTMGSGIRERCNFAFWVPLPQDLCYTFCSDTSNVWAVPDTSGLFLGLQELADYDVLAGLVQSTPLTALLTAEIEAIPNPNAGKDQTIIHPDTVAMYQEKFNSSSSTNLEAFFAPFKNFKLLSLPGVPNSSEITTNATRNFVDRAGLGGLIITTEKPSVTQVKGAQLIEEAQCQFLTKQFEAVLEMIINKLIGAKYRWKLNIWGYIFSFQEELKRLKEEVATGMTFALPKLASAEDMTMRDVASINNYLDTLKVYDGFKTLTQVTQAKMAMEQAKVQATAKTTGAGTSNSTGSVGRPAKSDSEIESDNTAASHDSGLDTSDTRYDFSVLFDGKCLKCGEDSDSPICDECSQEIGIESEEEKINDEIYRRFKK